MAFNGSTFHRVRGLLAALLAAAALAACAVPPASRKPATPAGTPATAVATESPAAADGALWRIDGDESLLTIQVLRGGPLARLGHNHVIAARGMEGSVRLAAPLEKSSFVLRLPVAGFTVDEARLRATAGEDFAAAVPDSARAGTRSNMLGSALLDAEHYPDILLQSQSVRRNGQGCVATVRVSVRGMQRDITLPLTLQRDAHSLTVSGALELRQSELGLTPFAVMMGALQVQDAMHLQFRVVARPAANP